MSHNVKMYAVGANGTDTMAEVSIVEMCIARITDAIPITQTHAQSGKRSERGEVWSLKTSNILAMISHSVRQIVRQRVDASQNT